MAPPPPVSLPVLLLWFFCSGEGASDTDLRFCGTWRHGSDPLTLRVSVAPGCSGVSVSANRSLMSIEGRVTARCRRSEVLTLDGGPRQETPFCLHWEPLLDQLTLQIRGGVRTLCWPSSLQGSCCTHLSHGPNAPQGPHGISNATVHDDIITHKTLTAYMFNGSYIDCKALCDQQVQSSAPHHRLQDALGGQWAEPVVQHPCAQSSGVEMKEDFQGYNVTSSVSEGVSAESRVTIQIPPALKRAAKKANTVVCTFFTNNSLFQEGLHQARVLDHVVGISVENEVITHLPEPIRIGFHHDVIPEPLTRRCVSWDTRTDPLKVTWVSDGCDTRQGGPGFTECLCNHLTYFSILVQLEPRPVCHLVALTSITSLGCALSTISCLGLVVFLCKKSRRSKEQSIPIHLGLAVSFVLLNGLFFFTGVLANVGGAGVCVWVAAVLHYTLLSALTWMGIEVFHTFWLVYMVFSPAPRPHLWNVLGFILPAGPVIVLVAVGDIYGLREVLPCEDVSSPYLMCWMKDTSRAWLAHYLTNMTLLFILVASGAVMLFLVHREIRTRDEWRQNRVAFLSIWGLSCLFGTTWGLTFLDFGPLSKFVLFFSCILNSFQGFFMMLRFYILDWMRRRAGGVASSGSSTGSARQHMLQEKS
ncbi:adhesion G-protein coupled receptor G1 [Antennarius striatus]|uniref:adhesion G-protein coupled receptor G1 n=1 Tax=Antennarius striatus TaxID=241820 RepID=UPI0035B0A68F